MLNTRNITEIQLCDVQPLSREEVEREFSISEISKMEMDDALAACPEIMLARRKMLEAK